MNNTIKKILTEITDPGPTNTYLLNRIVNAIHRRIPDGKREYWTRRRISDELQANCGTYRTNGETVLRGYYLRCR